MNVIAVMNPRILEYVNTLVTLPLIRVNNAGDVASDSCEYAGDVGLMGFQLDVFHAWILILI